MTFYEPTRKFPVAALFILLIVGGVGGVIFFSLKECKSSGILRSGKTSDATELYQVYPIKNGDQYQLVSLEGVYKTRIYERQGGITTRSGTTDIRLTIHDLGTGKQLNRLVLGDYQEAYTKILGAGKDLIWLYNAKEGLHSRSVKDFEVVSNAEKIIPANKDLSEGFAKADEYLGNLDELFAFDPQTNSLMVTTISGKKIWIDATSYQTVEAPEIDEPHSDLNDLIDAATEKAKNGMQIDIEELSSKIIEMAADMSSFSDIEHEADRVLGFDSCEYKFEGQTVRTIIRSNCPQPQKITSAGNNSQIYIEPLFLSNYNTTTKQYINPDFFGNGSFAVLHAKSIGSNTDLLLSLIDSKTQQALWTTKTGITLSNQRSGYEVNGVFGNKDSLFLSINNQLFAFNMKSGKMIWKTSIGKGDYNEQLYYLGDAFQNGRHYFLTANNYFTELSRDGIFIHGRTDYKLMVIDAASGKTVKKMEVTDSKPEQLPYYLGMSNGNCWFYSKENGLHKRLLPDLSPTGDAFHDAVKKAGITSEPVVTSGYDDAVENKYIAFDEKNNAAYFTTQNGLHYEYDLVSGKISEIAAPSDENYENYMKENSHVKFYRTRPSYTYHHEIFLPDGRSVEFVSNNSVSTLKINDNKSGDENPATENLKSNQFIEGQILANGVNLNGSPLVTENNRTPLSTNKNDNDLYILHKDKISPDAHLVISKYDVDNEKIIWRFDVTNLLMTHGEITRIYTLNDQLIFIFKTHPDLDDFFTCVSVNSKTGSIAWSFKF